MADVAVVTDSVADIPAELADALGISVVPLYIHFGLETFRDRVDMTEEQFYQRLSASEQYAPKTSQPAPGDFVKVYERLLAVHRQIVSIHPISRFSGTYNTALLARAMLGNPTEIEVVDSRSGSAGQALIVLEAARAALQGFSRRQVADLVRSMVSKVRIYIALETLEYVARSGRIDKAKIWMASLLKIKPIITVYNGDVAPADKVRGTSKIIPRLLDLCSDIVRSAKAKAAITHAHAFERARQLKEELQSRLGIADIIVSTMCPVVVANAGPGALAVAIYDPELVDQQQSE